MQILTIALYVFLMILVFVSIGGMGYSYGKMSETKKISKILKFTELASSKMHKEIEQEDYLDEADEADEALEKAKDPGLSDKERDDLINKSGELHKKAQNHMNGVTFKHGQVTGVMGVVGYLLGAEDKIELKELNNK